MRERHGGTCGGHRRHRAHRGRQAEGTLANWRPSDLLGLALRSLLERNDVDPGTIDDVVGGVTRDDMDALALESRGQANATVIERLG
jgi:acetyl-CoA acetyltransferase